jgi:hypothetical protein
MKSGAVRVAMLVVFVATMAGTAYLFWKADRQAIGETMVAAAFDATASDAIGQVAELRAAQQAYVAAGQGPDFWFARVADLSNGLKSKIASLKSEVSSPSTTSALDDAFGVLQDFDQMDRRAREFARARQLLLASDLIFSDGVETTRKLTESIALARVTEREAVGASVSALRQRQLYSFGAAIAGGTLIVLLLLPTGRRTEGTSEQVVSVAPRPEPTAAPAADLPLDLESWAPAKTAQTAPPPNPPTPTVDLQAVATVCGELARLNDTKTLPAVLERASQLLDAQGIILWIADPDARELAAIMAHGYPQNLVSRLGTIPRDADNATAAALRTGLVQTVMADAVSNGAIAAPLVSAAGCVGVMAAEVRHHGEREEAIVATAGIIASQLATLVGPPSARPKASEAAG